MSDSTCHADFVFNYCCLVRITFAVVPVPVALTDYFDAFLTDRGPMAGYTTLSNQMFANEAFNISLLMLWDLLNFSPLFFP